VLTPNSLQACVAVKIRKISQNSENLETEWENADCRPIPVGYWVAGFLIEDVNFEMPNQALEMCTKWYHRPWPI
jgi:hypothetical protein